MLTMPKKFCLFGDSKSTTFGLKLNQKKGWCLLFFQKKHLVQLVLTDETKSLEGGVPLFMS